jgi:RimJ/RimL family protein N-acetyltransferase
MRTVELLNINKPEHAAFMFDLAMACKDQLLDDYNNDIIVMVEDMSAALNEKRIIAFLCYVNEKPCGMIWVENMPREIGEINAAMMPEYRAGLGKHAYYFLRMFVPFCFESLNLRKLRAMISIQNKKPEKLLRHYGFKKVGLHPEESMRDGKPVTMVELFMTQNQYKGRKYG